MSTLDLESWLTPQHLASQITNTWTQWKLARVSAEQEWQETRNFLFATDTRTTTTGDLGWSNSTTIPKLTQIRDNLHANYMAALFPNDNWLSWIAEDKDAVSEETKIIVLNYMRNRLEASGFRQTIASLVYDFIDYGNAIAGVEYVTEKRKEKDKEVITYSGPKCIRRSPFDVVFNINATSFEQSPTIVRTLKNLGELEKEALANPDLQYKRDIVEYMKERRTKYLEFTSRDRIKLNGIQVDGFGNYEQYMMSGLIEVLEFEGTLYNIETGELLEDHIITVVDGTHIIRNVPQKTFRVHTGWRPRPDNLMAMGPLANLVGMQYRIDHLENMKADIFDQIAKPVKVVTGDIPEMSIKPGDTIFVGTEGGVQYLHPDATALNADLQIQELERRMEEFAGAPREAMGIRTPGEKTKFEVQQLANSSGRIFQSKITYFEETFMEPIINEMFREAKDHASKETTLERIVTPGSTVVQFMNINADDLKASGKLRPKGARHFAAKATLVQDINNFIGSPVGQRPDVAVHLSGKEIARVMADNLDLQQYKIYVPNIAVAEQLETQRLQQSAEEMAATEQQIDPGEGGVEDTDVPA